MSTSTVTSKGQITIPKLIRNQLKIQAGDRIHFFISENGDSVSFVPVKTDVKELKGIVPKPKRPVSLNAMNKAIKTGRGKL